MPDWISIAQLRVLLNEHYEGGISHSKIWYTAQSGRLPGVTRIVGRWVVDPAHIADIAAALCMAPKVEAPKARRSKIAA